MQQYGPAAMVVVVLAAFVIGYSIVSFVMKRLQELKNRPDLMEEIMRERPSGRKREKEGEGEGEG